MSSSPQSAAAEGGQSSCGGIGPWSRNGAMPRNCATPNNGATPKNGAMPGNDATPSNGTSPGNVPTQVATQTSRETPEDGQSPCAAEEQQQCDDDSSDADVERLWETHTLSSFSGVRILTPACFKQHKCRLGGRQPDIMLPLDPKTMVIHAKVLNARGNGPESADKKATKQHRVMHVSLLGLRQDPTYWTCLSRSPIPVPRGDSHTGKMEHGMQGHQ